MTSKTPLVTVVEDIEDTASVLTDFEKSQLNSDYNPKDLLPTSFSSGEDSDLDTSSSDGELEMDPSDEDVDPNETLNVAVSKDEDTYRGRPSSCVFVASLNASLSDDELSISVSNHFKAVSQTSLSSFQRLYY